LKITRNGSIQPSESQIVIAILHLLKAIGAIAGKTKTTGVFDKAKNTFRYDPWQWRGYPDITCFFNNRLYFIEVKSKTGRQSQEQKDFQLLCEKANIPYILAYSVEDVVEGLKKWKI
jgi:hypothetical protein